MKFLIDTLDNKTIEGELTDDLSAYSDDDILYIDGVVCKLSTARSMESEAVKEATVAIREFVHEFVAVTGQSPTTKAGFVGLNKWLEKWDTK